MSDSTVDTYREDKKTNISAIEKKIDGLYDHTTKTADQTVTVMLKSMNILTAQNEDLQKNIGKINLQNKKIQLKLDEVHQVNAEIKSELIENNTGVVMKKIATSFLVLIVISLGLFLMYDYQLIHIVWNYILLTIALIVYGIGYTLDKMYHKEIKLSH